MKVKICGVTHPDDAFYAASCGAEYIGIIFAERSKRRVDRAQAREIAQAAREGGCQPVAVFADTTLEDAIAVCMQTEIMLAQLQGHLQQILHPHTILFSVFDSPQPGSGVCFDWNAFTPPQNIPWMLAGGLNPDNVKKAIHLLHPHAVDVATGVEIMGSTRKDSILVRAFIDNAKEVL